MYINLMFLFAAISSPTLSSPFLVTQPPAPLNISCHKFVNETTGNIAFVATWEIKSENLLLQEHTLEAIDHYDVNLFEGESLTGGRPLLPSQHITHAVRCNENTFSSKTRRYNVGATYCNNFGDLRVIGLRPVNNPNIQYYLRVSVFLALQKQSSYPIFLFCSCIPGHRGKEFHHRHRTLLS